MDNEKQIWPWVAGAIVVVVAVIAMWQYRQAPMASAPATTEEEQAEVIEPTDSTATITPSETPDEGSASVTTPKTPVKPAPSTPSTSYAKAMQTYKYRIQFSQCHGLSSIMNNGSLTVKQNTKFMIDNRDKVARTIVFASNVYKVGAENFVIASIAKPGVYNVTCDGGGAATITVEK